MLNENALLPGDKTQVDVVLQLLESREEIYTAKWDYITACWVRGNEVVVTETNAGVKSLKTLKNGVVHDDLGQLIDMSQVCLKQFQTS